MWELLTDPVEILDHDWFVEQSGIDLDDDQVVDVSIKPVGRTSDLRQEGKVHESFACETRRGVSPHLARCAPLRSTDDMKQRLHMLTIACSGRPEERNPVNVNTPSTDTHPDRIHTGAAGLLIVSRFSSRPSSWRRVPSVDVSHPFGRWVKVAAPGASAATCVLLSLAFA
jgi:hypothetical protein